MNVRIPVANALLGSREADAVRDAVLSGRISAGPRVEAFEASLAQYVGARHAVANNSGTAALHLALAALGIGPGDEVILPSLTFISTANVVLYQGATPVLCDSDPADYNTTAQTIGDRITPRTSAILPVEMNGLPIDYDLILPVAGKAGVPVIMDSAESLGSAFKTRRIGAQAPLHCFSFFPNKTITTGEGGIVTTGDGALADRIRMLANQGQQGRYNHVTLGFNYRMTEMQGALGEAQMTRLDDILAAKERIASHYDCAFRDEPAIELPARPPYATAQSWFMYSIRLPDRAKRDSVAAALAARGIETRIGFPPIHTQPYYRERFGYRDEDLPASIEAWSRKLDLPSWPALPREAQDETVDTILRAIRSKT